jgi:hypothetical protein
VCDSFKFKKRCQFLGGADDEPLFPAWSKEPEPGPNRGDDLPADDTQLPSVGL